MVSIAIPLSRAAIPIDAMGYSTEAHTKFSLEPVAGTGRNNQWKTERGERTAQEHDSRAVRIFGPEVPVHLAKS
jgi:hypothetical protein